MHKILTALAVAATMIFVAVAAPDSAEARNRGGRAAAGIIGGLAAGAIIGSMIGQGGYYGGYYGGPGYYYGPGPYYGQGSYYGSGPYGYEPVYVQPRRYRGYGAQNGCWVVTDSHRGYGYYGPCR